jgi:hypothetical protein
MASRIILLVGLVIVLIIAIALFGGLNSVQPPVQNPIPNEPVACTMDAKMCPDGSYVGRVGPSCEFAACPVPVATSTIPREGTIETRLNQGAEVLGVRITPYEILEDSRCPIDVVCIQAGTVRLRTTVDANGSTMEQIFVLNQPVTMTNHVVELIEVQPVKKASNQGQVTNYIFKFKVMVRM